MTRKLEKQSAQYIIDGSGGEEEEKVYIHSEAFDGEVHSKQASKLKNDWSSRVMVVE